MSDVGRIFRCGAHDSTGLGLKTRLTYGFGRRRPFSAGAAGAVRRRAVDAKEVGESRRDRYDVGRGDVETMSERVNLRPYHAGTSGRFRLEDHDSGFLPRGATREGAERALATGIARLRGLQEKLYAENRGSVLIILQAMDAAGKDSAIEHVMSGVNPQGCEVHAFKAPSDEELDHNYLWRTTLRLPRRGRIGIFDRSYYEEVLVVRVHSELLERQR